MKIIRGIYNWQPQQSHCVMTIGNFDGVHCGHQLLLSELKTKSQAYNLASVVVIFEPQPQEFIRPDQSPARLTCLRDKVYLLEQAGVDFLLVIPFNRKIASMEASQVIKEFFVDRLSVKHMIIGDDFRFGHDARGNGAMLRKAGEKHAFTVSQMDTHYLNQQRVSSTLIREALAKGDFNRAEQMLGRPYFMFGRVIRGQQLGRQLAFPTANIALNRSKSPLHGVYIVNVQIDGGKVHNGIANIGFRPTVDGKQLLLETHLLDFSDDLYGKRLKVMFLDKVRDEQSFDGIEELKQQIEKDVTYATQWLREHRQQHH